MPPPERVGSAGTEVPARATETRNRTSRSHVYRVTGRSRILRLTANGIQHCPVLPARRAVGPSTSARRGLRTQALEDSSCAPVPPACRYGPNVRACSHRFGCRGKSALSFSCRSLQPHPSERSLRSLRPPIFAVFAEQAFVAKTLAAESTRRAGARRESNRGPALPEDRLQARLSRLPANG